MKVAIPACISFVLVASFLYFQSTMSQRQHQRALALLYQQERTVLERQQFETEREIRKLTQEVAKAQAELERAESQDPAVAEHLAEQTLLQDAEYTDIREEWLQLKRALRNEQDKAKAPNRRLKADLTELEDEISRRRAEVDQELAIRIKGEITTQAKEVLEDAQAKLELAEADLESIHLAIEELERVM